MTRRFTVFICLAFVSLAIQLGCGSADEDAAVEAATLWLQLLDSGDYKKSWTVSSAMLRNNVTIEDFEKSLQQARGPVGQLKSRKLRTAQAAQVLPNAPRGRYVVVEFDSVFTNKASVVETVTEKFEGGAWRVSGYRSR